MHVSNYDCFCVYNHVHPETKEVKYIGSGTPARAYDPTARRDEHEKWLVDLVRSGYSLWDIVMVVGRDMSKQAALGLEIKLLGEARDSGLNLFNLRIFNEGAIDRSLCGRPRTRPARIKRTVDGKYKTRCWD